MPEEVKILGDLDVIEVKSSGSVTREEMASSLSRVETLFTETGVTRVLVDVTEEQSTPDIIDLYGFASALPPRMRFAILTKVTQPTVGDVHFVETVARNRGFSVQIFTAKSAALSWLRS